MFRVGCCVICIYWYFGFIKFNKWVVNKLEGKVSVVIYIYVGVFKKV